MERESPLYMNRVIRFVAQYIFLYIVPVALEI